jgi:hypothetical protein
MHPFRLAALSTSSQAKKSQTELTQITAKARNAPCYSCIPDIAIQSSLSETEAPFRKQSELETLNVISFDMCFKSFSWKMFKYIANFI